MRPFTVLIGILLGSAASTTFGLAVVLIILAVLAGRHPDQTQELPRLALNLILFTALTAAAAGSFLGQLRERPWRRYAHAATGVCLLAMLILLWPRRA